MTGYWIGFALGIIVFLLQNFKPASGKFRLAFLIFTVAFLWGISYAHAGYWNILLIPVGVSVLGYIAAKCFPYYNTPAQREYRIINGRNYYKELRQDDLIGQIHAPGDKKSYYKIIHSIWSDIACSTDELNELAFLLSTANFHPISEHTKQEVLLHLYSTINEALGKSKNREYISVKTKENIETLFNAYISALSIREEEMNY